jgi:hypothetical protein
LQATSAGIRKQIRRDFRNRVLAESRDAGRESTRCAQVGSHAGAPEDLVGADARLRVVPKPFDVPRLLMRLEELGVIGEVPDPR